MTLAQQKRHPLRACEVLNYVPEHSNTLDESVQKSLHFNADLRGAAVTVIDAETEYVIMYGGIFIVREGVGETWAFVVSEVAKQMPRETLFYSNVIIKKLAQQLKLRRVQAITQVKYPERGKFMKRMGFTCEGIMTAFNEDGDSLIWSLTNNGELLC